MLVLALLGNTMDIENSNFVSDSDDSDDVGDNMDELCAVTQSVIVLLYHLCFLEYEQHQFCHQEVVKQILFPPEHRYLPRQAKAKFENKRDYFGTLGDLTTPIFKD